MPLLGGEDGSKRARVLIALHILLLVYSLSGFFSKSAASESVHSFTFIALYAGMLFILFVYAIGWQQIIKRLPLTLAFANKAITVVWGMLWGALFFGESISFLNALGAVLTVSGVVLFAIADGEGVTTSSLDQPSSSERSA